LGSFPSSLFDSSGLLREAQKNGIIQGNMGHWGLFSAGNHH